MLLARALRTFLTSMKLMSARNVSWSKLGSYVKLSWCIFTFWAVMSVDYSFEATYFPYIITVN